MRGVHMASAAAIALAAGLLVAPAQAAPSPIGASPTSAPVTAFPDAVGRKKPKPAATALTNIPSWIYRGVNILLKVTSLIEGKDATVGPKLDDISRQIAALSADVQRGFDQLEIDIANSRYAAAQDELRPVTTQVTKGMRYLGTINDPAATDEVRAEALAALTEHCSTVTVDTPELMQMYYGDPGDSMSQNGFLPAAWYVLMAGERAAQQASPGAAPPFLSYRTLRQMNLIGEMAEGRIAQYAVVKGVCRALKFTDPDAQQQAATAVRDLVVDGDKDTPGLMAIDASMPALLPRRTGVFPGSTVGKRALVVGNFNFAQQWGDPHMEITSVPNSATPIGVHGSLNPLTITGSGRIYYDGTTPEYRGKCLSTQRTDSGWSKIPIDYMPCDQSDKQLFTTEGGRIHSVAEPSKCLTQRSWSEEWFLTLRLETCVGLEANWWINGPVPSLRDMGERRLYSATVNGSPLGDNPDGSSTPWSRDWRYLKEAWLDEIQQDVAARGSSLTKLSQAYGAPVTEDNARVLPFHRVGWAENAGWVWTSGASHAPDPRKGNDTRTMSVKYDSEELAGPVPRLENFDAWVTSNFIFGVPVTGCAYLFERPTLNGFTCPTRRS